MAKNQEKSVVVAPKTVKEMSNTVRTGPGRRSTGKEILSVRKEVYFKPSEIKLINEWLRPGQKLGPWLRELALMVIREPAEAFLGPSDSVPITGILPLPGNGQIMPMSPGIMDANVNFSVGNGAHAIVTLHEGPKPKNATDSQNSSVLVFQPSLFVPDQALVHVIWMEFDGDDSLPVTTLEYYKPQVNGDIVLQNYVTKESKVFHPDSFMIMGVFHRAINQKEVDATTLRITREEGNKKMREDYETARRTGKYPGHALPRRINTVDERDNSS